LDIGVLGYIGIVWPKEHSPEVRSFPPGTPCICMCVCARERERERERVHGVFEHFAFIIKANECFKFPDEYDTSVHIYQNRDVVTCQHTMTFKHAIGTSGTTLQIIWVPRVYNAHSSSRQTILPSYIMSELNLWLTRHQTNEYWELLPQG